MHARFYLIIWTTLLYRFGFQKSPKRKEFIKNLRNLWIVKHKILKAGQTRWLSLEACVTKLLENYYALLSYFRSSSENQIVAE